MTGEAPPFSPSKDKSVTAPALMAFVGDDASWRAARAVAGDLGWSNAHIQRGGAGEALELFSEKIALPSLLLVDLDGAANPFATVARLASLAGAGTRVIGLGTANDIDLYRDLMAAGAAEYLLKPLSAEALHQVIRQTRESKRHVESQENRPGRLVVVIGARGGAGASTVAVNTAWLMAGELKLKTALLDLDPHFGTGALALDLVPGRGLREALETPDRLDSLLVASAMLAAGDRLSVLGAEEPFDDPVSFASSATAALIAELRRGHQVVVVDLPRHLVPAERGVLGEANQVVLVCEMSLAGIRDTQRLMAAVKLLGGPATVVVDGGARRPQVDRATFERGVQGKIDHLIPTDDKPMAEAANQGKAVAALAPSAPSVKALRVLARALAEVAEPARPGLLARLWKNR